MRIFFSVETQDEWIHSAYKSFADSLKSQSGYELFLTATGFCGSDDELLNYNVLDYDRISQTHSFKEYLESVANHYDSEFLKIKAHWGNPASMCRRIAFFKFCLSVVKPDLVIVWNGLKDIRGLVRDTLVECGIPVIFAEKGMLPDSWCIDSAGINAGCSLNSSCYSNDISVQQKDVITEYISGITNTGQSAWDQPDRAADKADLLKKISLRSDTKVIFFPGQVDKDSNITEFSSFIDVAEAVIQAVESMPEDAALIFKPHPKADTKSLDKIKDIASRNPRVHIMADINIWDAIELADLVISINSTVAFEALLAQKKIILLGDGVLGKVGLVEKTPTKSLKDKISAYLNTPFEEIFTYDHILQFTHFLKNEYYMFRNSSQVSNFALSCLQNRVSQKHLLSRDEIFSLLYRCNPKTMLRFDEKGSLFPSADCAHYNTIAIEQFEKAQKEFSQGNFVSAVNYCKQYQSLVDYEKLVRIVDQTDTADIDISVVVVTYKRSDDVRKAMEALRNQDAKGCKYEVVIVDNGQSDPTQYNGLYEQYICCPINFNLSEGRNIGVHFAHGKIVVFLDDDALVKPDYIAAMKAAFDQYEIIGLRGRAFPKSHQQANDGISIYNLGETPFPTYCNQEGNSAFRRDVYVAMGGMDPLLFGHEGSDLSWRIMQAYGQTNRLIYWPAAVIYHDFGSGEKVRYKRMLHRRSSLYLKYKYGVDIFADRHAIESELPVPRQNADIEWLGRVKPKVSIVIACYNCEEFLGECVESIVKQTLTEWELFLLDDSSTDSTRKIIKHFADMDNRIRPYYFDDNKGPYVRRNFAIENAASDFIMIQDADDIMAERKSEIFYNEITSDPQLGIVGSFYRAFIETYDGIDCTEAHELPMSNEEILDKFVSSRYITWHGSAIIRKSLFETIGLFDKHPYGSDKLWLAKAGEYARHTGRIRIKNIPEYLTFKREHPLSQQGLLPPLDPKSRRAKFQTYWEEKLAEVRQKANEAGGDIAVLLRDVDCSDYVERFGHLFEQWENQSLHPADLYRFVSRAISQLSKEEYVSCIITLDSVCRMVKEIEHAYIDIDFMRAIAYFAIKKDEACRKYLESEIVNHKNRKAEDFIAKYLSNAAELTVDRRKKIVASIICTPDGAIATDYQIDTKYPYLAMLNAKRSYGENPDSIRTTFMLGSLYMQLGKCREAAELLEKTISLLITQLTSLSSADSEDTGERLGECFTSSCTKLAQCYMKSQQYGKIKTIYCLLLSDKIAKLPDDQRPAIQRIVASMDKVSAQQLDIRPPVAPTVTVVMPTYNVQDFIADAIKSVLSQSYKDFELIVIDDGSTDLTASIINSFGDMRIRYIFKSNGGLASARNAAIAYARGQIIMLLDSDDMMAPGFIEKHIQALQAHPDVDLVYCDDQLVNMDGSPQRILSQLEYEDDRQLIHDLFCCGYPVIPFRTAMRRSVFDRIGLYDESLKIAEDYDMIRRFVRAGLKRFHLGEPLYIRRVRPNSLSRAQDEEKSKAHFEVIRRFTEVFGYEELFPDVNWNSIEKDRRRIAANYLIASVYRALAHNYCKSNVPYNATLSLDCAVALLKENLQIDSTNGQSMILLDQCENAKGQLFSKNIAQAVANGCGDG